MIKIKIETQYWDPKRRHEESVHISYRAYNKSIHSKEIYEVTTLIASLRHQQSFPCDRWSWCAVHAREGPSSDGDHGGF